MQTSLLTAVLLTSALLIACTSVADVAPGMAAATFAVHCYDVGAGALHGKPGVLSVERGWSGGYEVDRVVYDPQIVTLQQLEYWLRQAGTYIRTLEHRVENEPEKEMLQ